MEKMKRAVDLTLSVILLTVFSPMILICALLAKNQSPGGVFYKAKRLGQNGKIFSMYKFRTMVENADTLGHSASITRDQDPRVTKIGRFLRGSKLDELPQLINVIKGEMSFVGPRPEAPEYIKYYTQNQLRTFSVKPGITGISQIENRDEEKKLRGIDDVELYYTSTLMPEKLKLDLWYVDNANIWLDLKILVKTVYKVIFH